MNKKIQLTKKTNKAKANKGKANKAKANKGKANKAKANKGKANKAKANKGKSEYEKRFSLLKGGTIVDALYGRLLDEFDRPVALLTVRTVGGMLLSCFVLKDAEGNGPGFLEIVRLPQQAIELAAEEKNEIEETARLEIESLGYFSYFLRSKCWAFKELKDEGFNKIEPHLEAASWSELLTIIKSK